MSESSPSNELWSREAATVPPFARNWALFLDVDGTLLNIADRPDAVVPPPALVPVLETLVARVPVALISGRRIADLDRLFSPLHLPAAGQHGAEWRYADEVVLTPVTAALESAKAALTSWAAGRAGILVEDKGATVALHYRRAPEQRGEAEAMMRALTTLLGPDYVLVPGHMLFEFRPARVDKGRAIAQFMQRLPYAGRVPVFIGDDRTDEDGFAAVNSAGGHSVKVGAGPTAASWRLSAVAAVLAWLEAYAHWHD
jgi:trehalose 6-phosphate phosphatase